jgi:pimeloyl-ACP methyl ester carboxylesterase
MPTVMFCAHGGTYNRSYWDFGLAGDRSYSFAKYMTDRGRIVVAWDALATGGSRTETNPWRVTSVEVAEAAAFMVREISDRLRDGTLTPPLPRIPTIWRVGVGHSLGGMTVARQQARHESYDAVAILGWTNLAHGRSAYIAAHEAELDEAVKALASGRGPEEAEQLLFQLEGLPTLPDFDDYRRSQRQFFYADDVPGTVVEADAALGRPRSGAMWVVSRIPGIALADTAKIKVPVFLGYGESDISVDPWSEPSVYKSSDDVTLHILRRSAHCHNFASTRAEQWGRIATWDEGMAHATSGGGL